MAAFQSLPAFSAILSHFLGERRVVWPAPRICVFPSSGCVCSTATSRFGRSFGGSSSCRSLCLRARRLGLDSEIAGESIADDFYSVLGVTPDATPDEIKKAYYSCMKVCHPDRSGNHPDSTAFCIFVNEVYEVLIDPEQRMIYDEINGYALTAANPFREDDHEKDHTFVDEFSCIGCKNCANTAPNTFEIEMEYGRARVMSQQGDPPSLVQRAIETCPVDCIYSVTPAQLTLLEDEMRRVERVNVGMMLAGMGGQAPDVFGQASWRWEKRQAQALEKARRRMMQEQGPAWWEGMFTPVRAGKTSKPESKASRERAARMAAAARRWRQYSRQMDRQATMVFAAARALHDQEDGDEKETDAASL